MGMPKGWKMTDEQRAKLSKSLIGNKRRWKGDDVGYMAKHMWVKKYKKKTGKCEDCGTTQAPKYEWANISEQYHRDLSDYKELCTKCHKKFDAKDKCVNGHFYLPDNLGITRKVHRYCKICRNESQKKYNLKKQLLCKKL